MPGTIKDAIRQYGFEYVKYTAEYLSKNKVTKIRSYFIQALEKGWAEQFMAIEKDKSKKKKEQLTLNTIEMQKSDNNILNIDNSQEVKDRKNKLYNEYQSLSEEEQEKITKEVFDDYIKMSGQVVANPVQKMAFQRAKETLIKEYLYKRDVEEIKEAPKNLEKDKKDMKEIHMGTLIFGDDFTKNKDVIEEKNVEDIYKDMQIEDITFVDEIEEENSDKKIKKSDIIYDMKKVYNEISLFQMELLDALESLKTIEQETQDKIVRIVGISKHFEATVGGYYIKIEYVKDKESTIKIVKK